MRKKLCVNLIFLSLLKYDEITRNVKIEISTLSKLFVKIEKMQQLTRTKNTLKKILRM